MKTGNRSVSESKKNVFDQSMNQMLPEDSGDKPILINKGEGIGIQVKYEPFKGVSSGLEKKIENLFLNSIFSDRKVD